MTTVRERMDTPRSWPLAFWTLVAGAAYAGLCLVVHVLLLPLPAVAALGALPVVAAGVAADLARLRNEERTREARRALALALLRFAWPPYGESRGPYARRSLDDAATAADCLAVLAERRVRADWALLARALRSDEPAPRVIGALRSLGDASAAECLEAAVTLGRPWGRALPPRSCA